jgi:hypothetical protein
MTATLEFSLSIKPRSTQASIYRVQLFKIIMQIQTASYFQLEMVHIQAQFPY